MELPIFFDIPSDLKGFVKKWIVCLTSVDAWKSMKNYIEFSEASIMTSFHKQ